MKERSKITMTVAYKSYFGGGGLTLSGANVTGGEKGKCGLVDLFARSFRKPVTSERRDSLLLMASYPPVSFFSYKLNRDRCWCLLCERTRLLCMYIRSASGAALD